jgi:O-antigen/teichoic acid export membrane protein
LLAALLTVACTLVLVVWWQWGIRGALLAQVAGGLLALLPSLYLTRTSFGLNFDGPSLRRMLAYSVPLIPSSLAVVFALYFDRIALKDLVGLSEVGVYAVGQKISLVVALALIGFRSALTPLVYANHARASTPGELAQIFRVFCLAALAMTLGLSAFAREIVGLISAEAYQEAAAVVPLLIFSVLLSNMYIFAPGLDIGRKTALISLINIGVAALNLGLNYLLIPQLGILGAAWSALLAFGAGFAVYMYVSQRLYPVPHDWAGVAKLLAIVLAGMGAVRAVALTWGDSLWIRALLVLLILGLMVRVSSIPLAGMQAKLVGLLRK